MVYVCVRHLTKFSLAQSNLGTLGVATPCCWCCLHHLSATQILSVSYVIIHNYVVLQFICCRFWFWISFLLFTTLAVQVPNKAENNYNCVHSPRSQHSCSRPAVGSNIVQITRTTFFVNVFKKMDAGSHFWCPKITFGRISGHFRSISNFLWIFFTKWLPVAILDVRKSLLISFLSISHWYTI